MRGGSSLRGRACISDLFFNSTRLATMRGVLSSSTGVGFNLGDTIKLVRDITVSFSPSGDLESLSFFPLIMSPVEPARLGVSKLSELRENGRIYTVGIFIFR